jgi:hypothetical protein
VILAAREKVDAGEAISIDVARTHASSQRHRYNADPLAMIVARRLAARRQRRDDNQAVALAIMADVDRLCRAPYCQRLILALSRLRKFDGGCVAAYGSLARRLMAMALLLAEIGHLTPLDALGVKGARVCGASPAAIVSAVEDALSPFALSALFEATNAIYESLAPSR